MRKPRILAECALLVATLMVLLGIPYHVGWVGKIFGLILAMVVGYMGAMRIGKESAEKIRTSLGEKELAEVCQRIRDL